MTVVTASHAQHLWAALLWAGDEAAAAARSAGTLYGLQGVNAEMPPIVVRVTTDAGATRLSSSALTTSGR